MSTKTKAQTSKPKIDKANSLVMAYYSTTAPACNRLNRSATAKVAAEAGAQRDAARLYNTVLNAKGTAVGRAISLQNQTGTNIRRLCLPCQAGGYYVRVADVPAIQNIFDDAQYQLDQIRAEILLDYASIVAPLRRRLGAFADQVKIPSATEVASKFSMNLVIVNAPAPLTGSVLTGLADEVVNRTIAESQRQIDEMLRAAHAGPVNDLRNTLEEFIDRMRNAERLHLTQFDKLRDEAKRVADLNILDVPEITELVRLTQAAAANREAGDPMTREVVAAKAEQAMAQVGKTLDALGL
jgi:hypothetical protein